MSATDDRGLEAPHANQIRDLPECTIVTYDDGTRELAIHALEAEGYQWITALEGSFVALEDVR